MSTITQTRTEDAAHLAALVNEDGKCTGSSTPDDWFGDDEVVFDLARAETDARSLCAGCPVIAACLALALARGEDFGVWGGTAPHERAGLSTTANRRPRNRALPLVATDHGTQLSLWDFEDVA